MNLGKSRNLEPKDPILSWKNSPVRKVQDKSPPPSIKGLKTFQQNLYNFFQLEDEEKGFMVDLTGTRYDFLFKYGDFGRVNKINDFLST